MWSRSKSKQMADPAIFVNGLIAALSDEQVVKKFQHCLTDPLKFDISKLQDELNEVKNELKKSNEMNKQIQSEMSALREQVQNKEYDIAQLRERVKTLETHVDEQDQFSRNNSLRISGMAEKTNENLLDRFITMATSQMNVNIEKDNVEKIYRVGKPTQGRTRNIVIKLKTYEMKTKLLKGRKNLRKSKEETQKTDPETQTEEDEDDDEDDENETVDYSKVFINEDLTKMRSHLLWLARQKKKMNSINDCWSFNGKIMVKDSQNQIKQIKSQPDLDAFP